MQRSIDNYTPLDDPAPQLEPTLAIRITQQMRLRRTEWIAAAQCLIWGLILLLPNNVFAGATFATFVKLGISEWWMGATMLTIGAGRLLSLIVNGARRRTTTSIRLAAALAGCGIFTAISLCFASSGVLSVWAAAWPVAAVVEFMNIYDTAKDARKAHGRRT